VTREPIDERHRGPATRAGMPTVLLSVNTDAELYPAVSVSLDDGPAAVPIPEHLWRCYQADLATLHTTEARVLTYAARWRNEQAALQHGVQDPAADACQVCGRPRAYPACDRPIEGARVSCLVLLGSGVIAP
jgi:hypothetical protein